jgi:hypothetical protein
MSVVKVNTYETGVNNDITNVVENVDANRLGTDLSHVVWSGSAFVVKSGSIVEANGSLYVVQTDIGLGNSTGFLTFDSSTLAFAIVDTSRTGKYDAGKSGYYNSATVRILKWRLTTGGSLGIFYNNIGQNPEPTSNLGLAIGQANTSVGVDAQAIGARNTSNGIESITYGVDNSATANGISLGSGNSTTNGVSTGKGNDSSSGTGPNVADGIGNRASGINCVTHGMSNKVSEIPNFKTNASAYGTENESYADEGSAVGRLNRVRTSAIRGVSHGYQNDVYSVDGVGVGNSNIVEGVGGVGLGIGCKSQGDKAVSMGAGCDAGDDGSVATGIDCVSIYPDSVSSGINSISGSPNSVAMGIKVETAASNESAFGTENFNMHLIKSGSTQGSVYTTLQNMGHTSSITFPCFFVINVSGKRKIRTGYIDTKSPTAKALYDDADTEIFEINQGSSSLILLSMMVYGIL